MGIEPPLAADENKCHELEILLSAAKKRQYSTNQKSVITGSVVSPSMGMRLVCMSYACAWSFVEAGGASVVSTLLVCVCMYCAIALVVARKEGRGHSGGGRS